MINVIENEVIQEVIREEEEAREAIQEIEKEEIRDLFLDLILEEENQDHFIDLNIKEEDIQDLIPDLVLVPIQAMILDLALVPIQVMILDPVLDPVLDPNQNKHFHFFTNYMNKYKILSSKYLLLFVWLIIAFYTISIIYLTEYFTNYTNIYLKSNNESYYHYLMIK